MTQINLLPWRARERSERKQRFLIALGFFAAISAALLAPTYLVIDNMITAQKARNQFISDQIKILDDKIAKIKELKRQKELLLARMNIIQQLQADRSVVVHMYDELVRLMPEGVYLLSVEKRGVRFNITGVADSNVAISRLMRNIEQSPWVTHPVLKQIETQTKEGVRSSQFQLEMYQKVVNKEGGEEDEL